MAAAVGCGKRICPSLLDETNWGCVTESWGEKAGKCYYAAQFYDAERGYIDEVIQPRQTRRKLITALRMLANKRATMPPKKHGNIPL